MLSRASGALSVGIEAQKKSCTILDVLSFAFFVLIVGGALGNIIDRFLYGQVVDFIDWYYGSYHWPAFNIADSAICVGVTILIFRKPADQTAEAQSSENQG